LNTIELAGLQLSGEQLIEARGPLGPGLPIKRQPFVVPTPVAKHLGGDIARRVAKAPSGVVARDDQIRTIPAAAPQNHMHMGVVGVVVIDRVCAPVQNYIT